MKVLIAGGTGTLGRALTKRLLENEQTTVVCLSRDELKQKEMERDFRNHPRLHFCIGDIRDRSVLDRAFVGVDTIFHVAALKHVDTLELNPEESVKTNILGTMNIADAAVAAGVKYVVFSSTDKAVAPINAYGMSKGIAEKILFQRNATQSKTRFSVYRWGNVLSSRGSVIPNFVTALKEGREVPITDFRMSRFWLRIQDAVEFMSSTYSIASAHSPMIPPIKAAPVTEVVHALGELIGVVPMTKKVPIRPGEKIHESLMPDFSSDDPAHQYVRSELKDLLRGCL